MFLSLYLDTLDGHYARKYCMESYLGDALDHGFDWIFGHKILGLVTKYGGVNSHMAIRCAELGIPAAIGCGEQKFETLKSHKIICLDCSASNIYNV